MKFEIWSEGFSCTGNLSGAVKHGVVEASTFKKACDLFASINPEFEKFYDPKRLTYWGCRLFGTEQEAKKAFG